MSSWKQRSQIFRTMPRLPLVTFLAGVACIFGAYGTVQDAMTVERTSHPSRLFLAIIFSGVPAALWALFGSMRMIKSLIAMGVCQILILASVHRLWPPSSQLLTTGQMLHELERHNVTVLILIFSGYLLLVAFFRMEGRRFFAAHTEIRLASEIQKELVPAISQNTDNWQFYGVSLPAGTVGGDLFDVVTSDDSFCAYVADVAGHGVPAGVLMSMVKTAVRMRITSTALLDDHLLSALNDVLQPLISPSAYLTFAYVASAGDSRLNFSLAGHLPILHYRKAANTVERCSVQNLPVGMFAGAKYSTAEIAYGPGDIIAMITDGLTEIFDRNDRELGSDHVEKTLIELAGDPLSAIATRVIRNSENFGKVADDRTLLLMRCVAPA